MNELIERLSKEKHQVEATRIDESAKELKKSIDRNYVHIMFAKTGTELGIKLDGKKCDFTACDFEKGQGVAHFEGGLTLNYDKVRVIADVDLATLKGEGILKPVNETEYAAMMNA